MDQKSPAGAGARPRVTLSYAQTLDGRLATRDGSARWISGPELLRHTHELRAAHDVIMVGVGTVLADDPRLTVRLAPGRDPLRVVVDSALRLPLAAAVLADGAAPGTLVATTAGAPPAHEAALAALGAAVLRLPATPEGQVDLAALLAALGERGARTIMVEGGARLLTALLRARLADRLVVTIAPKILGAGIEAIGDLGIADLARAIRLVDAQVSAHGADLVLDARIAYPDDPAPAGGRG